MNAVPPSFDAALALDPYEAAGQRWEALAEAARIVAVLGGIEPAPVMPVGRAFAALLREADPLRAELAERGVADLIAILEPGIAALLAVNARQGNPGPAAQALWREYDAGCFAVLALLSVHARA